MQLVPNQLPPERLLMTMDAPESSTPVVDNPDSPFVLKGAGMMSGNSRWIFIGALIGMMLLSVGGIIFSRTHKNGEALRWPVFIKARTNSIAAGPDSDAPPAPIVVQLSPEMVRVTAIALGHPRLAVINGQTYTEGDSVTIGKSNDALRLTLQVVKISDGRIDFSDGAKLFSARLTIPAAAQAKH